MPLNNPRRNKSSERRKQRDSQKHQQTGYYASVCRDRIRIAVTDGSDAHYTPPHRISKGVDVASFDSALCLKGRERCRVKHQWKCHADNEADPLGAIHHVGGNATKHNQDLKNPETAEMGTERCENTQPIVPKKVTQPENLRN